MPPLPGPKAGKEDALDYLAPRRVSATSKPKIAKALGLKKAAVISREPQGVAGGIVSPK